MEKLTSISKINELKSKYNFFLNKRYGQNFLTDENIIHKILEGAHISKDDYILEIGPGIGAMTQHLCENAKHVIAVEIDKKLKPILEETLNEYDNITIINDDILKINIHNELKKVTSQKFKVIANLPYYITTDIIMTLLENNLPLESITVMVQKEVAQRMVAIPGGKDYGSLSVAVQYYSKPEIVAIVPKTVFIPQPKVESSVIKLNILENPPVEVNKDAFFKVVRASFAMRRKTILNCISARLNMEKNMVKEILENNNIDPLRRGETLSLEEFAQVARNIESAKG
ncbi:MAG: 16S rRNA (adenine(1518)-N(6)/adenine(1519)-N(6))-dimethyltransferase RsmA [Eubacteriaceae bacterium]